MRGKVTVFHHGVNATGDHPRTCGEKELFPTQSVEKIGSPPHMRRKGLEDTQPTEEERITPAHAGKSTDESYKFNITEDHPRTCGEKY